MDELLHQYAERLQDVYDKRTAGDYSFLGILSEFMNDSLPNIFENEEKYRKCLSND